MGRKPSASKSEPTKPVKSVKTPITPNKKDMTFNIVPEFKNGDSLKCKNETQKKLIQSIKNNDVTICLGPAGTGKSIISIYAVLKLLKDNENIYDNILLLKSVTQLKDEVLPPIPGDAMEKMVYQNMSFIDSLNKLLHHQNMIQLIDSNVINFGVIGGFRGRSISKTLILLDEAQNISHDNLKTILTRISDDTKIVILGDPDQIDIKNKVESSLKKVVEKIKSNPMDGVGIIEFTDKDIVRHRLTSYFISLFKE